MRSLPLDRPPNPQWNRSLHEGLNITANRLSYVTKYDPAHLRNDIYQNGYVYMCRYPDTPHWALTRKMSNARQRDGMMYHYHRGLTSTPLYIEGITYRTPNEDYGDDDIDWTNEAQGNDRSFEEAECNQFIEWLIDTYGSNTPLGERSRNMLKEWYTLGNLKVDKNSALYSIVYRFRKHAREQTKKELDAKEM